ncbi:hypothetical protein VKT23_008207 [Stygiomarasmius scandens]|uniref:Peptidase C14 caspase domain-containing protein n=1 Tax=Marasmiellus scandens TaxID=2682957 RepID=A0ABR1JIQ3_9AGAR
MAPKEGLVKKFSLHENSESRSRIVFLVNEDATRAGIISNFESHFIKNSEINCEDAMVFFFAGHGSRVDAPDGWRTSDGKIETYCPYDDGTKDTNGHYIPGIPDLTMKALIRKLAAKKGNNIVIIFDSCHSGGIVRLPAGDQKLYPRYNRNSCPFPINFSDRELYWEPDVGQSGHLSSYVLLSACRQEEQAYEVERNGKYYGAFTNALIERLFNINSKLSYLELIDGLSELTGQHPQCEGVNKNRIVFRMEEVGDFKGMFELRYGSKGKFIVEAGRVHGVSEGSKFRILTQDLSPVGYLVVQTVDVERSTLIRQQGDTLEIPQAAKASILDGGDNLAILQYFVDHASAKRAQRLLAPILVPDGGKNVSHSKTRFRRTSHKSKAAISLTVSNTHLNVKRHDPLILNYSSEIISIPLALANKNLWSIMNRISNFRFHLGRYHISSDALLNDVSTADGETVPGITMNLYRLTCKGTWWIPEDENKNLFQNNIASLEAEPGAKYGIQILNHSEHNFFAYLFCFDPSYYCIEKWYEPASKDMAAPLKSAAPLDRSSGITVGYGAGGGDFIEFYLDEDESSSTTFLKLFVCTKYVDMGHLEQDSVYEDTISRHGVRTPHSSATWGSWLTAVTIRKKGSL